MIGLASDTIWIHQIEVPHESPMTRNCCDKELDDMEIMFTPE